MVTKGDNFMKKEKIQKISAGFKRFLKNALELGFYYIVFMIIGTIFITAVSYIDFSFDKTEEPEQSKNVVEETVTIKPPVELTPDDFANMTDIGFANLTIEEKEHLIYKVFAFELQRQGIPYDIKLEIKDLNDETKKVNYYIAGFYSDKEQTVYLDKYLFLNGTSRDVFLSLFHEIHHVYQLAQIKCYENLDEEYKNLTLFAETAVLAEELSNFSTEIDYQVNYENSLIEKQAIITSKEIYAMYMAEAEKYIFVSDGEVIQPDNT